MGEYGDGKTKLTWGDLKAWAADLKVPDEAEIWDCNSEGFLNDISLEGADVTDSGVPELILEFAEE